LICSNERIGGRNKRSKKGNSLIPRASERNCHFACTTPHARARERERERGSLFSRSLLRCANFLLQNCAIQRNATRISLVLLSSEKHAAQRDENLRKNSLGNYKSAALPAELCRQKCAGK